MTNFPIKEGDLVVAKPWNLPGTPSGYALVCRLLTPPSRWAHPKILCAVGRPVEGGNWMVDILGYSLHAKDGE